MTLFRRWRRIQPVASTPLAFDDSTDSHVEQFPNAGETSPSLAPRAAPRSYARTYAEQQQLLERLLSFGSAAIADPLRSSRSWRRPSQRPGRLDARRSALPWIRADARAFRALELNPRVRTCVGRRARREVLFAQRVAGRRGRSPGRGGTYRRNLHSAWSC